MSQYGFTAAQWAAGLAEMRTVLIEHAKRRAMVPYSTLVAQVQSVALEPHSSALAAMLGEISESEDAAGRGMLSVIVVHKHGDMEPGAGFYDLAERLGKQTSDRMAFWVDELHRVHAYWSGATR